MLLLVLFPTLFRCPLRSLSASVNLGDIFTFALVFALALIISTVVVVCVFFNNYSALLQLSLTTHTHIHTYTQTPSHSELINCAHSKEQKNCKQTHTHMHTKRPLSMGICVCVCVGCVSSLALGAPAWPSARAWLSNLISLAAHSKS